MDTRQIFEDWYFGENHTGKARERSENGEYKYLAADSAWKTWQAAAKAEREDCAETAEAATSDANKYDIAEAIRKRSNV